MVISASELATLLARHLAEMRKRHTTMVVSGTAADFPQYREQVGYLQAITELDEFVSQVTKTKGEF